MTKAAVRAGTVTADTAVADTATATVTATVLSAGTAPAVTSAPAVITGRAGAAAPVVAGDGIAAAIDHLVENALKALADFETLDQEQVDHIVKKASVAALHEHVSLAQFAVRETG